MPVYDYECECGRRFEAFSTVEQRATQVCPDCRQKAQKIPFSRSVQVTPEFKSEFYWPFGKFIGSRGERSEELKRRGWHEAGYMKKPEFKQPKPEKVVPDDQFEDFAEEVLAAKARGELTAGETVGRN